MARSSRGGRAQRRILVAVAAVLIPLIAGCEAGSNAPSLHWHQPTDGSSAGVGGITISNAFVLGAPIGSELTRGQSAGLFLALTNTGSADRLVGISAPGVAKTVLLPGGQVSVNSNHQVLLTGPAPEVVLEDLVRPLGGGTVVTIHLLFANAGTVTMQVPVMPKTSYFDSLSPAPSPSPSPSGTGKSHHHGKHSASASPSPSSTP